MSYYASSFRPAALMLGFVCLLSIGQPRAEHEVDHRYHVRGYVLDAEERGIADQQVTVSDDGKVLGSGETDRSGYYSIHLHLHDTDLRRVLTLRAGANQARLRVKFDPNDKTTVRTHDANFVGGEFVERDLGRFRLPVWVYALAGLILVGFILVMLEKRRRAKIRTKAIAASSSGGKPKGKRRRRKR